MKKNGKITVIMCSHVDDFCFGGNLECEDLVIGEFMNKLKVGSQEKGRFSYIGVDVEQLDNGITMQQNKYISKIPETAWNVNGVKSIEVSDWKTELGKAAHETRHFF